MVPVRFPPIVPGCLFPWKRHPMLRMSQVFEMCRGLPARTYSSHTALPAGGTLPIGLRLAAWHAANLRAISAEGATQEGVLFLAMTAGRAGGGTGGGGTRHAGERMSIEQSLPPLHF